MKRVSFLAAGTLIAATLSAPAASATGYEPPVSFALATVDADASNAYVGYGFASNRPSELNGNGHWSFYDWPRFAPDNAAFTDGDDRLLVLRADIESDTFEETTYDGGTLATLSHHSVPVDIAAGWRVSGFYYGPDNHIYALQRRSNETADLGRIVMRILKYDRALGLVGTAEIAVQDIAEGLYEEAGRPKDMGTPSFTMHGKWLVVHTSREKLPAPHHQSNVTFLVDTTTTPTMPVQQTVSSAYVSHSMNQFVASEGNDALFVDHGDALPRSVRLAVAPDYFAGPESYDEGDIEVEDLLTFAPAASPATIDVNYTGATVNGVAAVNDQLLVTGVAEPQTPPTKQAGNIYLLSASLNGGTPVQRWLTTIDPSNPTAEVTQPTLTPLGDDTFALLYSVNSLDHRSVSMHYRRVDEDGETLTEKVWTDRELGATSTPVKVGARLYWVGAGCAAGEIPAFSSNCSGAYVFGLDLSDPAAPVALGHAVAGGPGDPGGDDQVQDDRYFPARAKVLKPSGKARAGKRLTALVSGFPAGTTFRYQWYVGGKAVAGATASRFKIKKKVKYTKRGKTRKLSTKGKAVKVSVTARRSGYVTTTYTSPGTKVRKK